MDAPSTKSPSFISPLNPPFLKIDRHHANLILLQKALLKPWIFADVLSISMSRCAKHAKKLGQNSKKITIPMVIDLAEGP